MAGVVPVIPRLKFTNSAGVPIVGGSVTVYYAGTTDKATTYQDKDLTIENENPVTLDANGEALFWVNEAHSYKYLLKDSLGATVSGWPVDNVRGAGGVISGVSSITVDRFSGTGAQTAFTLSTTPLSEDATEVYISGVYVQKNAYSVAGAVLTFAVAPASGTDNIEVNTFGYTDYPAAATAVAASASAASTSATAAAASEAAVAADRAAVDAAMANISYEVPVAYAGGLSMTRATQTVSYDDGSGAQTYAANVADIPFTTTGVWATDSAKFNLISFTPAQTLAVQELAAYGAADHWRFGRPVNAPPIHPGQLTQSDINVFGFTALSPVTGRIVAIFRKGTLSENSEGSPYLKYSDDDGATWSAEALMFTEASVNLTNLSGGFAPNGDLVVFYVRYESPWPTFLSLNYRISTDEGATWGSEQTVDIGTSTVFSAYGKMETLDNGRLMQSWYGEAPTFAARVIFSDDNGATWGDEVLLPTTGGAVTETDICALGGGAVVAVSRRDGQATYAMATSTDNGATWTYRGLITQVSHTYTNPSTGVVTTNISPCWLEKCTDDFGRSVVAMYYFNRAYPAGEQPLRVIYARADELLSLGTSAWQTLSDRILANGLNGTGYPSAVHPHGDALGVGWSIVNNDVRFFHSYEGTPSGAIWNGRSLGLALNPGSNRLAVGGALSVGTGTAANTPPVNGAIIEGDLGVGETTSVGSFPAKVTIKSTTEQLRLRYSDAVYAQMLVSNVGYLNIIPTGGRVVIGTTAAATKTLNIFHDTAPRVLLSHTASGMNSGLQFQYIGSIGYIGNLSGGALNLTNLLQITATATVPTSPAAGYVYLDDGTNTGDSQPHFRYYTGSTWKDL